MNNYKIGVSDYSYLVLHNIVHSPETIMHEENILRFQIGVYEMEFMQN